MADSKGKLLINVKHIDLEILLIFVINKDNFQTKKLPSVQHIISLYLKLLVVSVIRVLILF